MKKKLLSLLLFAFLALGATAQIQKQRMQQIYPTRSWDTLHVLKPGESIEQSIQFTKTDYPVHRRLRVVGGTQMPGKFKARGETLFREAEFLINDYLDTVNVWKDKYSLYFTGNNDPFERHAYNRLSIPTLKPGMLTLETRVKTEKLHIGQSGDFGIELQLYFKKEGRHPDEVYDRADSVIFLPIAPGSSKFKTITNNVTLPANIASILIRVGGTHFSGECWMEAPRFVQDKKQIAYIPFLPNEKRKNNYNYWVGVNLSSRSWPRWKLELNDRVLFEGNIFDRASDIADFYIPLPELHGQGKLKLTLLKEKNRAAFAYDLRRLQLIEESARDFEIAYLPKYVTVGDTAGILVEINKPGITLTVSPDDKLGFARKEYRFDTAGLHAINFTALQAGQNATVNISDGSDNRKGSISQLIVKAKDRVYLSSGDEIYIDKVPEHYDYFFKWYLNNRIGNFYQFRPSYQWSGFRIANENIIGHYTGLLTTLNVPFAWQVEGRTLAATKINPSREFLAQSPRFQGKQAHENDGGYYYWRHFHYEGLFSDMAARTRPYGGIFARHRPIYTDHGTFIHYDPYKVTDMADGARYFVENLSYSRGESSRHTGPSVMFRYLYQAGYQWLGAEQMYGPENTIMSALRGASRAYGKNDYGSLHAVQWGSFPFTDPKHATRFYLSLAVAYMHGSSHINTEEGLWTDEYANDRYTEAGKAHTYAQHRMLDFIQTHSRRGEFYTKIGIIQGRNDAWKSFVRGPIWSQEEKKWAFNEATESFDLLKVFYPNNIIDASGPDGWFTATPYGPVDILPIEAKTDLMKRYDALIFLGWNSYDQQDFERLTQFVENGGTLLLSAAHLNSELQPDKPTRLPANTGLLQKLLGVNFGALKEKTEIAYGNGKVIYFPQAEYPINKSIRAEYEKTMRDIATSVANRESGKAWMASSPHIDFAAWDATDRRTIYVLNVDWKSTKTIQPATLMLNNKPFRFEVARYSMPTIHCFGSLAVLPMANTSDVLEVKDNGTEWLIRVQTTGSDKTIIFNGINDKTEEINITDAGINELVVKK